LIPLGVFAYLGAYHGFEASAVFVAAILTILGYSISDTVVVFDRVRENTIYHGRKLGFSEVIHKSVMQTLTRSLSTTLTTILPLGAIYFFGGPTLQHFSLALIIGICLGSYSSIFVASPILYYWSNLQKKYKV
jgi:preprotein translocase subunit SecF